jgi:hypothetical protein
MIPALAQFVWLGQSMPWVNLLAVASAVLRGGFDRVLFHHSDALARTSPFDDIARLPRVEVRRLEPLALLEAAGGPALVDCFRDLSLPAAKSNVLRIALLAEHGGVYLDTDTLTLRTFGPLLEPGGVFCGEERIVFPAHAAAGFGSRLRPGAVWRMAARDLARRLPGGYRLFRRIERYYPAAVNNAVLGGEAGHPFFGELLARMSTLPAARRRVRYAFGTHLLQAQVREYAGTGLRVLPPAAFFPLAPEISEHYFRVRPHIEPAAAIGPDSFVAHWYASVRTEPHVARLNPAFIRAHAGRQLYSALALPIVEELGTPLGRHTAV